MDNSSSDPEKGDFTASPSKSPEKAITAQDWTGPDDPEDPQNWWEEQIKLESITCSATNTRFHFIRSITKKAYHTAATACLGFSVTCGSSMISPATPEIAERFNVSRTVSILALSLFVLGLAVGPMIAAPISEIYGRSVVYKVSACAFMLFVLGAGFSESLASLLVCRFLAGTIGGPVLAVGAGTNADMYNARNRAVASSLFVMMPVSSRSQIRLVNTSYWQFNSSLGLPSLL
jgi:hypothetical protein